MTKQIQTSVTALLIFMSATAALAQANLNAGPQDQPPVTKIIVIDQIIDLAEGAKVVKAAGHAFNIMDASTFGDAKIVKLMDAGTSHVPLKVVVRGNVIVDVK